MDGRYNTGMIGVSGNNSSRIDGQTSTPTANDMESLTFTLTSGSPMITLNSFNWDFASASTFRMPSFWMAIRALHTWTCRSLPCPLEIRNMDTSAAGLTLGSGANALVFTSPASTETGTHGYGLSGMTLQVAVVPEPATTGLLGLGGFSILLIRRFKSRD